MSRDNSDVVFNVRKLVFCSICVNLRYDANYQFEYVFGVASKLLYDEFSWLE